MKLFRFVAIVTVALAGVLASTGAALAATAGQHVPGYAYDCTGGNVPAGTYSSMIITGICYMPRGTVRIRGDLQIGRGALLDAATPGDPASAPVLPATVLVGGNVRVGRHAVLVLGCSPQQGCEAITYDRIGGSLTGSRAEAIVLHSVWIGHNATEIGGGGGAAGGAGSGACFTSPIPKPWSEDPALSNPKTGSPQFSDFEDNSIRGSLTVIGVRTCWFGTFRNRVGGNVVIAANATSDPDGMEFGSNLIGRDAACFANKPAIQWGDSGAAPSIVGNVAIGQCGFKVVLRNPAPEAGQGVGIKEHITVSARLLKTYSGTHREISNVQTIPVGKTQSGDKLIVEVNDAVFTGDGLHGPITYKAGTPLGQTGEAVALTAFPNGSESFEAFDVCACRFQGHAGTVDVDAYGTISPHGAIYGFFLVTSGGTPGGGLGKLAGWGTFSSNGEPAGTLRLVEHLKIT